jgi:hypothetical protein
VYRGMSEVGPAVAPDMVVRGAAGAGGVPVPSVAAVVVESAEYPIDRRHSFAWVGRKARRVRVAQG